MVRFLSYSHENGRRDTEREKEENEIYKRGYHQRCPLAENPPKLTHPIQELCPSDSLCILQPCYRATVSKKAPYHRTKGRIRKENQASDKRGEIKRI